LALTPEQKEAWKKEKAEKELYWQEREKQKEQDKIDRINKIRERQMNNEVRCPVCGSTQISAGNKGFGLGKATAGGLLLGPVGLLGGLLGSKKVMVTCLNCGKQWKAGEY